MLLYVSRETLSLYYHFSPLIFDPAQKILYNRLSIGGIMAEEQEDFLIKEDEYNESKYNVSLDDEDIISAVEEPKVP